MTDKPTPRRAAPEPPRSRKPLVAGLAAVAVAALAVGGYAVSGGRHDDASAPASSTAACDTSAGLAVDPAWSAAITSAAKSWQGATNSTCAPISVDTRPSAEIAQNGLGQDVAWIPEDASWTQAAKSAELRAARPTVLGSSPLVLVNQPEAATALAPSANQKTLAALLTRQQTWADHGHPEWGSLKLVLPTVDTTVAGAAAYASLAAQAATAATPVTAGTPVAADPKQVAMSKVQHRLVAQVDLPGVTDKLAADPADATGVTPAGPRTGVTTEALALASSTPLLASHLDDRTGLQLSFVDPSGNETVEKFAAWLATTDGQKALAAGGVRAGTQVPSAEQLAKVGLPAQSPAVAANDLRTLAGARQLLAVSSRRAAAMLVLDTSGSMAKPLDETSDIRKIDLVLKTALSGWNSWPPGMATGLMTFNATNDAAQKPVITTVVPLMRNDSAQWVKGSQQYQSALSKVQVSGGTPLYQAIEQALASMEKSYVDGMPNKVIVVTDGSSQDAAGEPSLEQLLAKLPKKPDATRPVQVIYLALGKEADFATLQKIASATGQTAIRVDSLADLQQKLAILFS